MIHRKCDWCGKQLEPIRPTDRYHNACLPARLVQEIGTAASMKRLNAAVKKYGLTAEEYWGILDWQGHRCAMCRRQPSGLTGRSGGAFKRFHVDHDHVTLAVRGLLCFQCNSEILPALRNDPWLADRAGWYLRCDPVHPGMMVPVEEEE